MSDITDLRPPPARPPAPPLDVVREPGLAWPAALLSICLAGVVAILAAVRPPVPAARPLIFPVERETRIGAERVRGEEFAVTAQSITPITSLTAGLTGALQVSADRIDLWARTSSSTATLNLVEYNADDAKWAKVGADCAVTTDLTLCRYVAKRGTRYWHVYKASGTMAYVGLEAITLPVGASVGSIESSGVTASSLPSGIDAAKLADGSVSNAEFQRLDGVVDGIQSQIDGKAASSHNHGASDITAGTLDSARLPTIFRGVIFARGSGTVTAGVQYLVGPGAALTGSATALYYAGTDLNAQYLACDTATAPGGTETAIFTVRKSSDHGSSWSDTSVTCTIVGPAKTCLEPSANAPLSAGDLISIKVQGSASTAAADVACSIRITN